GHDCRPVNILRQHKDNSPPPGRSTTHKLSLEGGTQLPRRPTAVPGVAVCRTTSSAAHQVPRKGDGS
ncbi:MAG: hypothetical protein MI741_02620, partial [Rhodospirillales bacterium]|nr:hypothetical protein [Rhodospirillales bacterium]